MIQEASNQPDYDESASITQVAALSTPKIAKHVKRRLDEAKRSSQ